MSKPDSMLEFATLEELVEEIKRRHSATVILTLDKDRLLPTKDAFQCYWSGGVFTAIGMLAVFRDKLMLVRYETGDNEADDP